MKNVIVTKLKTELLWSRRFNESHFFGIYVVDRGRKNTLSLNNSEHLKVLKDQVEVFLTSHKTSTDIHICIEVIRGQFSHLLRSTMTTPYDW